METLISHHEWANAAKLDEPIEEFALLPDGEMLFGDNDFIFTRAFVSPMVWLLASAFDSGHPSIYRGRTAALLAPEPTFLPNWKCRRSNEESKRVDQPC